MFNENQVDAKDYAKAGDTWKIGTGLPVTLGGEGKKK